MAREVLGNHHPKSPQRLETKHYGSSRLFPENRWHTGGSRDDRHKDEIDIESFSWGETQSGTFAVGGGGGSGKISMQDFHSPCR